ncbi:MAG: (2Fe-2S)-binding protein [bacterium]
MRIKKHPILEFPVKKKIEFYFEDKKLEAIDGESIAAALIANNIRIFRFSEKKQRPRGLYCAVGKCASCLMEVDGKPNIMTCITPVKQGMKVKRQKGRGDLI